MSNGFYNATLKNTFAVEGNDVSGKLQLSSSGPTGVDQNALPELQAFASSNAAAQPMVQPVAATISAVAVPAVSKAKASAPKVSLDSAKLQQELAKSPKIQYKGKTYVLLDNVMRLTK
jgi:hypothetical protein